MNPLRTVWTVFKNELRLLFASSSAWVFLAATVGLAGLFFVVSISAFGEASLRNAVANWVVTLIFCVPLVTMRQLAAERRDGVDQLLLSAPVPLGSLVVGKWLAATVLCGVWLVLTLPMPLALLVYGDPDVGGLVTTYLGLGLCCSGFAAAGLFSSSLTRDPMVAAVLGAAVLVPFWLVGSLVGSAPEAMRPWLEHASLIGHLRSFAAGVLDLGDVAWFVGFTFSFLFLAWRSLEARRWA